MTRFKLKIKSNDCIEIWQNNECLAESDDFKEALTYIATLIVKGNIKKYKVVGWEKGKSKELTSFDPHAVIKDNPNIEFDDEDDDEEFERRGGRRSRRSRENRRRFSNYDDDDDDFQHSSNRWVYTPRYTRDDYAKIGQNFADELSNRND